MITQSFKDELEARKYSIVSFLSTLFLALGAVASMFHVFLLVTNSENISNPQHLLNISLTFLVTVLFIFVRFFYIRRSYKVSFYFFLALFSFSALIGAFTAGTLNPVTYIIIFLMLLSTSIVISVRTSVTYTVIILIVVGIIGHLQEQGVISFETSDEFLLINTIVYLLLIFAGAYVVKIGYEQIEHSYKRAYDYAKELEELNKHLDQKVRLRTKQLEESLEMQAESVHSAAVMGSITKPMLHDLSTPLSSLVGSYELLKKSKFNNKEHDLVKMSNEAVKQIIRIVENAKLLMDNKNLVVEFSPYELISIAVFVSKHELQKSNVSIELDVDPKIRIIGIPALFERIVVNLIVNAIEELRQCDGKREISISAKNQSKYFILEIEDSGRGIREEYLNQVFEPDFTLKTEKNLGFGLTFVKNAIEKKFGGDIEVTSKVGKFTKFILRFDKNFNERNLTPRKGKKISTLKKSK